MGVVVEGEWIERGCRCFGEWFRLKSYKGELESMGK